MSWLIIAIVVLAFVVLVGAAWRQNDVRRDRAARDLLLSTPSSLPARFDPAAITELPEAAQRFLRYTIQPGTALHPVVEIDMGGEIGLGSKDAPGYRPMSARQVLAPPHGLLWQLKAGAIAGSDGILPGNSWTRFWLFGLFPVARVSGSEDHRRSAFGRLVAESVFWAPASLLDPDRVAWQPAGHDRARAIVSHGGLSQAVDILIRDDGQPTRVVIQRWSNENPDRTFREQPFGGDLSGFETFDGYRLPTVVEGGNHIGTDAYFPFYKARVTAIRFPSERTPQ